MKGFKNREEFDNWAYNQFNKYGIRQPDTYTEQNVEKRDKIVK